MRTTTFEAVTRAVTTERKFQDDKWGVIETSGHTLGEWLLIAESELNEAKLALIKGGSGRNSLRSEFIQTIAVLFAALEEHGLYDPTDKRQL